ncbi:MAG: glycosyltransferase family 2 protein [Pseudomonadota bacterium]
MSDIAVSVIMPSYNDGDWLTRAVESVLAQAAAVPGLELLLVDDASTDAATRATQERLAGAHAPHVSLLRQAQNGGPARARNAGIAAARGRWIAFLDGDDYWLPGGLAARWAVVAQHPQAAFIGTDYRLENLAGEAEPQGFNASRPRPRALLNAAYASGQVLCLPRPVGAFVHAMLCWTGAVMARAELIRAAGGFPLDLPQGEDDHLWLHLARRADFHFLPQITAAYVQRAGSLSNDGTAPGHWKRQSLQGLLADPQFAPWAVDLRRRLAELCRQEAAFHRHGRRRRQALAAAWRSVNLAPAAPAGWLALAKAVAPGH